MSLPFFSGLPRHILILCTLVVISGHAGYAFSYKTAEYYENPKLSGLLDTEGFKFGLSKDEISSYYGLKDTNPSNPLALTNDALMNSYSRGFYVAVIDEATNMLLEVSKCISMEEGIVNSRERIDAFKAEYGLKNEDGSVVTMGGVDLDNLPVMHHGRKLQVKLTPIPIEDRNKTALILTVFDQTFEALDCY